MKRHWRDLSSNMEVCGARLMDRVPSDKRQARVNGRWGRARDHSMVTAGHTKYLARLTTLRNSLEQQEQLYLAKAVDRLRENSLSNKATNRRMRMTGHDIPTSLSQHPKNNLLTTAEQFRQRRPKKQRPVIFPLLGTQIFDRNAIKLENSSQRAETTEGANEAHATSSDVQDTPVVSQVDDTVDRNLHRLRQVPRNSPDVGRKYKTPQEQSDLTIKSRLSVQPRLHRQNGRHLASLLLPFSHSNPPPSSQTSSSTDVNQLQFLNHKSGIVSSTPRIPNRISLEQEINFINYDAEMEHTAVNNSPMGLASCARLGCSGFARDCTHNESCGKSECGSFARNCIHNESCLKEGCNCSNVHQHSSIKIGHHRKPMTTYRGKPSFKELEKQLKAVVICGKIMYSNKEDCGVNELNKNTYNTGNAMAGENHINVLINISQSQKASKTNNGVSGLQIMDECSSMMTSLPGEETTAAIIPPTRSFVPSLYMSQQSRGRDLPITSNSDWDLHFRVIPLVQNSSEQRGKRQGYTPESDSSKEVQGSGTNRKHIIVNIPRADTQEQIQHDENVLTDAQQTDRHEKQNNKITLNLSDTQSQKMQKKQFIADMSHTDIKENGTQKGSKIPFIPHIDSQEISKQNKPVIEDMPHISFNAPSPVPPHLSTVDSTGKTHNQSTYYESSLKHTAWQHNMRLKELANLLKDVKDLSSKTETLRLKSTKDVAMQQNIF